MRANLTIRRIISGALICIFALSVTPVFFVHTMFATHKDKVNSTTEKGYQLSTGGFNCNCEDFVAEGQFLNDAHIIVITAPKVFSVFNTVPGYTFFSQHHFFSELRGPPAIV